MSEIHWFETLVTSLIGLLAWLFIVERHRLHRRDEELATKLEDVMKVLSELSGNTVRRDEQQRVDEGIRRELADLRKESHEDNIRILAAVSDLKDSLLKLAVRFLGTENNHR